MKTLPTRSRRAALALGLLVVAAATAPRLPAAGLAPAPPPPVAAPVSRPRAQVYFSPRGGCTAAVVAELAAARKTALVQAYLLTSAPIIDALIAARVRGVRVEIVLDGGNLADKFAAPVLARLAGAGLPLWTDSAHAIAHNKVMVLDGATVLTGSFNFTRAAESSNAENLLVLRGQPLAALYAANFRLHQGHSTPYPPPPGPAPAARQPRGPGREQ